MNMSFFARPPYLGNRFPQSFNDEYSIRLSGEIRGRQIAEYLGAKFNPRHGYEDDLCIYVKPMTLDRVRDKDWVDCSDGPWVVEALRDRPQIKVIAHSRCCYDYLRQELSNVLVEIPQQHLNWENARRKRKEVVVGGYIGSPSPSALRMYQDIGDALGKAGFAFRTCFDYKTRQDAANFYQQIDFLVVGPWNEQGPYKTPAKLINAASFGIPSIAYPLAGYAEWEGQYLRAKDTTEIVAAADWLREEDCADRLIKAAAPYHISQIAERYKVLR